MVSCFSAGGQRRSLSDDATRSCRSVLRRMRLVGEERERESQSRCSNCKKQLQIAGFLWEEHLNPIKEHM